MYTFCHDDDSEVNQFYTLSSSALTSHNGKLQSHHLLNANKKYGDFFSFNLTAYLLSHFPQEHRRVCNAIPNHFKINSIAKVGEAL